MAEVADSGHRPLTGRCRIGAPDHDAAMFVRGLRGEYSDGSFVAVQVAAALTAALAVAQRSTPDARLAVLRGELLRVGAAHRDIAGRDRLRRTGTVRSLSALHSRAVAAELHAVVRALETRYATQP